jgi:hypothetical protein
MKLIIPAAGQSSRFPNMKPKWLLTHPTGNLMVIESILGLNLHDIESIYLVVLKEHIEKYKCYEGIRSAFNDVNLLDKLEIIILDSPTKNQPETVTKAIEKFNLKGHIFIKDVDSYFDCRISACNEVSIFDLNDMSLVHASNKSFVTLDDNNLINNIVEKQVISSKFCVGGYSFGDAQQFVEYFRKLDNDKNLYVSHIIFKMLLDNIPFRVNEVKNYLDWGTIKEWNDYKASYVTLFIDLDGILVKDSSMYFEPKWGTTNGIKENVEIVNELYNTKKAQVIITTSRKKMYEDVTIKQLKGLNIKYHKIIFDLFHSKRIIINDFEKSNPYKSCDAINIRMNNNDLKEMLEDATGLRV